MITEDYVSFETAKLLKEKGFDGECDYLYVNGNIVRAQGGKCNWNKGETIFTDYKNECSIPTLQMGMKWLEEIHHILIVPDYIYECTDTSWIYKIYKLDNNGKPERNQIIGISYDSNGNPMQHTVGYRDYNMSKQEYATRTEAVEEGIKYSLKNLI